MLRKRLLSLLATILLGLTASPAAAVTVDRGDAPVQSIEAATENGLLASMVTTAVEDPEVDVEVPGVGRIVVDVDEQEQSLTVGLRVDAAGVDETVTVGGGGGGGDEEPEGGQDEAADAEAMTPEEQAAAEDKAAMDQAKADAIASGNRGPAFTSGATSRNASGSASAGTGVTSSVRSPSVAPAPDVPTAATDFAPDGSNPWLRLMGVVMLAGTGTAWSFAKRHGLA